MAREVKINVEPPTITPGGVVSFAAEAEEAEGLSFDWRVLRKWEPDKPDRLRAKGRKASWTAESTEGAYTVTFSASRRGEAEPVLSGQRDFEVLARRVSLADGDLTVSLRRADTKDTPDQALWALIKQGSERISFERYAEAMDVLFCRSGDSALVDAFSDAGLVFSSASAPFADMYSYKLLKVATEAFLLANCGVAIDRITFEDVDPERLGLARGTSLESLWRDYLEAVAVGSDGDGLIRTLPYLALIRRKLPEVSIRVVDEPVSRFGSGNLPASELCYRILQTKFTAPCLIELIWSYWHEEGGLVQSLNAIAMRFQNRRGPGERDPLAELAIDPLRPLNNLLWGYIQDEQHRLSLARRVHEYVHEYGLTLYGRAVPSVRAADTRAQFLEAFHTLLARSAVYYRDADDTTTVADAFPVLNALRDAHLLLSEGAHNQYGDLPWTARHEMLMQQWLLARPEFREFLPTRVMVAYPEPWMDRVDAMKRLQGWTDISIRHFHDLAVFGEQILLSIRLGNWSEVIDRAQAANWATHWRQEVQWYIHAYRSVTGVDLSAEVTDTRPERDRYLPPAVHLQRRQLEQRRAEGAEQRGREPEQLPQPTAQARLTESSSPGKAG